MTLYPPPVRSRPCIAAWGGNEAACLGLKSEPVTGSAYDRDDSFHRDVVRILHTDQRRMLSPFVLAELDYLLATRAGQSAELQALQDVAGGAYDLSLP